MLLIYDVVTDCPAYEPYLFFMGGLLIVTFDGYETIRRWSGMRPGLLLHHTAAFVVDMGLVEWDFVPRMENPVDWRVVLFLTLIGCMWMVDYFHADYRTCPNLSWIQLYREFYLVLAVIRLVNIVLLVSLSVEGFVKDHYYAMSTCTSFLAVAYIYNSYKAIFFLFGDLIVLNTLVCTKKSGYWRSSRSKKTRKKE